MKEFPVTLSDSEVRAVLDGSMTQYREPLSPQPYLFDGVLAMPQQRSLTPSKISGATKFCPYGKRGDILRVQGSDIRLEVTGVDIKPAGGINAGPPWTWEWVVDFFDLATPVKGCLSVKSVNGGDDAV